MSKQQQEANASPAESKGSAGSAKVTIPRLDAEVLDRARGILARINMVGPIDSIEDLSSLVTEALRAFVALFESEHNRGKPYPTPYKLPPGRRPAGGEPDEGETAKITVNRINGDVWERARGILNHINMVGPIDGIDDVSSLVTKALRAYVAEFERTHNQGKPYPTPYRLPPGPKTSAPEGGDTAQKGSRDRSSKG